MRIFHCLWDDKFMIGAINLFETDKRHTNDYYYVSKNPDKKFKYINNEKVQRLNTTLFLEKVCTYDVVVLHNLNSLTLSMIIRIPSTVKVVWFIWGFDFYGSDYPVIPLDLYGKDTADFRRNNQPYKSFSKQLKNFFYTIRKKYLLDKALSRIDYFSGVYPYEYDLLCKYRKSFHGKPLDFYYGNLPFFIKDVVEQTIKRPRKNVILGNSGDQTNNHYEALSSIKCLNIDDDGRIIIPMSYNAKPEYKKWIQTYANQLFPGKVLLLDKYLPFDEYTDLVSSCRVAIYNHVRQQASDNILMQLMYGAKVYLSEKSLAFNYFKSLGIKVYSLQSDISSINIDISDREILSNRQILTNVYGESTIIQRIKVINNTLQEQ